MNCRFREFFLFLLNFLLFFLILILILLSVAFTTVFERHLLSLSQNRLGPNKTSFGGVVQAILDGVKLIKKEQILPSNSSEMTFIIFPGLVFLVLFLDWSCLPFFFFFLNFQFSFLFLLCLVGFSVYGTLLRSLVRKSKYSSLGGLRARRQSVSFEIAFSLYFVCFLFVLSCFELGHLFNIGFFFLFLPFLWIALAELGRAPFDFAEGERELVRGYNTEFSRIAFVLLFLGEYGILLFFSGLIRVLFFYFDLIFVGLIFFFLLFIRSVYPRYRYDLLINFFWKILLPLSLFFLVFFYLTYF